MKSNIYFYKNEWKYLITNFKEKIDYSFTKIQL
jgi:hypothetical protein